MAEIDTELKAIIALVVKDTLKSYFGSILTDEQKTECWLNKAKTMQQFGFSESFMRHNAEKLPRTKADGGTWVYPRNEIQKLMWSGKIKNLDQD